MLLKCFAVAVGFAASVAVAADRSVSVADDAGLDWVRGAPRDPRVAEHCDGAYVEPAYPLAVDSDPLDSPIEVRAGSVEYWIGDRAELRGGVDVTQGNRSLSTDTAVYHEVDQTIDVEGRVTVREPGLLMRGEAARFDVATGAASVDAGRFVLHHNHLRGEAAKVALDETGRLTVEGVRFTRCEPGNDSWVVGAREVDIPEGSSYGTARGAVLRVRNVPVFYSPYISFPVTDERLSGFLFPDMSYESDDGFDIALPYYFNLAPNYDATATPRWIDRRGGGGALELRHLSAHSDSELAGSYLYKDEQYNGELSRDDYEGLGLTAPFDPADRWLVSADHLGRWGNVSTFVDATRVSDDDYFRDLGTDLSLSSRIDLEQRAEIRYAAGDLQMRLWAQDFQNLDPVGLEPYQRLPELAMSYRAELPGPFVASLVGSWSDFDRSSSDLVGIDRITGQRRHLEPRLQVPLGWSFGFVRLTGGYRYTKYDLDDVPEGAESEPNREIGFGSADAGLFFERETQWFGAAATQTLEPRLYYLYQEDADQASLPLFDSTDLRFGFGQLYRDNRFSGLDRIGDADQLSLGVTSRMLDASSGQERMRASLGQILYFEDRDVTLRPVESQSEQQSSSSVAGEVALALGSNWQAQSDLVWDPHDNEWTEIGAYIQYRGSGAGIFNAGYRSNDAFDPLVEQSDVSFYWPALPHWSLLGRWNYDIQESRTIEAFGGIEFNDCCWQIRVVGRQFLSDPASLAIDNTKSDQGVFLQVVLKGLAGLGGRIDTLLENGIRGFRPEEY